MKILVDMNLTLMWVYTFQNNGYEAVHWSSVGKPTASDHEIMEYALHKEFVVFTHDLDFGDILAATEAKGPSVIQIRTDDTTPDIIGNVLLKALSQFGARLEQGALITLTPAKMRARILPLRKGT